jgi:hypothetical protein
MIVRYAGEPIERGNELLYLKKSNARVSRRWLNYDAIPKGIEATALLPTGERHLLRSGTTTLNSQLK